MTAGQRKRQSADHTREAMLDHGVALLSNQGLAPSLDEMTIDGCLEDLDIARSSAYNAWSDPAGGVMPQRRYQRAVLKRFVLTPPDPVEPPFRLAESLVEVDATIRTREELRRELNRLGAAVHFKNVMNDREMRVRVALMFAATTGPDDAPDAELLAWFGAADELRRNLLIDTALRPVIRACGMRPRTALNGPSFWDQVSVALGAYGAGLFPRHLISPHIELQAIPVARPDGTERIWTLMGLGLDALIAAFFENDPASDLDLPSEADI